MAVGGTVQSCANIVPNKKILYPPGRGVRVQMPCQRMRVRHGKIFCKISARAVDKQEDRVYTLYRQVRERHL